MCRMTASGMRLRSTIDKPGLWAVLSHSTTGEPTYMYVVGGLTSCKYLVDVWKAKYFIRVKLKDWGVVA